MHTWGGSASEAVAALLYRRMCHTCHKTLRELFCEAYPNWSEQLQALGVARYLLPAREGWWSLATADEEERVVRLVGGKI